MPKKNTSTPSTPRAPRRRASTATPTENMTSTVTPEPLATASDAPGAPQQPSYDEIATAAYERYLRRGGDHGRDFDDWVEAERELMQRGS